MGDAAVAAQVGELGHVTEHEVEVGKGRGDRADGHHLPDRRVAQRLAGPGRARKQASGSDLAALRTSARREGGHYIVNGQKTWTTLAHYANWIFCLVRTDPAAAKPQEGISFLLIDMASPGVTVRPIVLLDGSSEVNEVFFDNVRVPVENLVGAENRGWTCAKYLLTHERTNITGVGFATAGLDAVRRIAAAQVANGRPLLENPAFALRLAQVEIALMALSTTNMRMLAGAAAGDDGFVTGFAGASPSG